MDAFVEQPRGVVVGVTFVVKVSGVVPHSTWKKLVVQDLSSFSDKNSVFNL